ncbi:hypothetical protein [Paenarthrobacter sp.]|uniref:hypothetical protein n=1 Tax=Paenarthrobacter sp. TaxID=1931993 RepID=UPI002810BAF9|nr:hypothetical protein [Paenarthrobacter sp.]
MTRTDDGLVLGSPATRPEFSAILEAAGAVLVWDVVTEEALPAAIVWDPVLATEWAWQIYGVEVTTALLAADSSPFAAVPGAALESARVVARCRWARSWWPASHRAAVPALDTRLLDLQEAAELVELEHLLDDSYGVDDELQKGLRAAEYLENEVPPSLPGVVAELIERIRSSADDRGIGLDPIRAEASEGAQGEFALAAGAMRAVDVGTDSTRPIAAGSAPLDLSRVAPGTADAAAEARWSVHLIDGVTVIEVAVERAPRRGSESAPQPLGADFAGVSLELVPNGASFSGRATVPSGILLTRPEERTLTIASPGYGDGWRVDSAALIDAARKALARALTEAGEGSAGSAFTTVAEREAAVRA